MADVADFINVIGAQALLYICQASPLGVTLTQEIGHERVHPGADKQRGRVVFRYERGRGNNRVPALCKEVQE